MEVLRSVPTSETRRVSKIEVKDPQSNVQWGETYDNRTEEIHRVGELLIEKEAQCAGTSKSMGRRRRVSVTRAAVCIEGRLGRRTGYRGAYNWSLSGNEIVCI